MNPLIVLQRAEILFWRASVGLMKNQRLLRWMLTGFAIVLVCSIVVLFGLTINYFKGPESRRAADEIINSNPAELMAAQPVSSHSPISGQNNLLVILVDALDDGAVNLMGVWLIGKADLIPQIVFLPLFPTHREAEADEYVKKFELTADAKPAPEFIAYLRSKKIWWDHYLIVDSKSLADLVELSNGFTAGGRDFRDQEIAASIPAPSESPEASLRAQVDIANSICHKSPEWIHAADPVLLSNLMKNRILSDFNQQTVISADSIFGFPLGEAVCEFPTLKMTTFWIGRD